MQTLIIDIINDKALKLLHDLELMHLIRVHKQTKIHKSNANWTKKYKGAMLKQPLNIIDKQLNDLRNAWE